jgi:hypothetical protein
VDPLDQEESLDQVEKQERGDQEVVLDHLEHLGHKEREACLEREECQVWMVLQDQQVELVAREIQETQGIKDHLVMLVDQEHPVWQVCRACLDVLEVMANKDPWDHLVQLEKMEGLESKDLRVFKVCLDFKVHQEILDPQVKVVRMVLRDPQVCLEHQETEVRMENLEHQDLLVHRELEVRRDPQDLEESKGSLVFLDLLDQLERQGKLVTRDHRVEMDHQDLQDHREREVVLGSEEMSVQPVCLVSEDLLGHQENLEKLVLLEPRVKVDLLGLWDYRVCQVKEDHKVYLVQRETGEVQEKEAGQEKQGKMVNQDPKVLQVYQDLKDRQLPRLNQVTQDPGVTQVVLDPLVRGDLREILDQVAFPDCLALPDQLDLKVTSAFLEKGVLKVPLDLEVALVPQVPRVR